MIGNSIIYDKLERNDKIHLAFGVVVDAYTDNVGRRIYVVETIPAPKKEHIYNEIYLKQLKEIVKL